MRETSPHQCTAAIGSNFGLSCHFAQIEHSRKYRSCVSKALCGFPQLFWQVIPSMLFLSACRRTLMPLLRKPSHKKHSALLTNDAPAVSQHAHARLTTLQHAVCPHIRKFWVWGRPQEFLGRGYLWKPSLDGFSHPSKTSPPRYSKPNNPWFRNRSSCNKPLIGLSCLMLDLVSAKKFCL